MIKEEGLVKEGSRARVQWLCLSPLFIAVVLHDGIWVTVALFNLFLSMGLYTAFPAIIAHSRWLARQVKQAVLNPSVQKWSGERQMLKLIFGLLAVHHLWQLASAEKPL